MSLSVEVKRPLASRPPRVGEMSATSGCFGCLDNNNVAAEVAPLPAMRAAGSLFPEARALAQR